MELSIDKCASRSASRSPGLLASHEIQILYDRTTCLSSQQDPSLLNYSRRVVFLPNTGSELVRCWLSHRSEEGRKR